MALARDSISVFTTRIIVMLLSMVNSIIITRILGPSLRGAMEILLLIPYLLVSFGNLGIGNANLFFVGKKKYSLDKIASNSFILSALLGATLLLLAYSFFFLNRKGLFDGIPLYYTHLIFSIIPLLLFQKFIQYTLLGKEDIRSRNALVLFPVLVNFFAAIIFVVLLKWALLGVLAATAISNVFAFFLSLRYLGNYTKLRCGFNTPLFYDSLKFGFIPFLVILIMNLNFRIDVFLLRYFWDNSVVGYYSIAVTVAEKFWLLPQAIGLVLFARISNTTNMNADKVTPVICRFTLWATFIATGMVASFAHQIIPLFYGDEFLPSVRPLLFLVPGIVFMTIYLILNFDLTARGKAKITLYIFSCSLILNVAINLFLIPKCGAAGAAISSSISYSIGALVLAKAFSAKYSIPLITLFIPKKNDFQMYIFPLFPKIKLPFFSIR